MKSAKTVFRQCLKDGGMLYSERREQVLDIFFETKKYFTTDDVYKPVRKKNPKIGLAAVCRAMKEYATLAWQERPILEMGSGALSTNTGISTMII